VHAGRVSSLKEDIFWSACSDSRPAFLTLPEKHTHIWTTHFILTQTDRERKSSISEQDVQAQIPFLAAGVRSELIFKGLCFPLSMSLRF